MNQQCKGSLFAAFAAFAYSFPRKAAIDTACEADIGLKGSPMTGQQIPFETRNFVPHPIFHHGTASVHAAILRGQSLQKDRKWSCFLQGRSALTQLCFWFHFKAAKQLLRPGPGLALN